MQEFRNSIRSTTDSKREKRVNRSVEVILDKQERYKRKAWVSDGDKRKKALATLREEQMPTLSGLAKAIGINREALKDWIIPYVGKLDEEGREVLIGILERLDDFYTDKK